MAVFLIIGTAAMQVFRAHVPLFTAQQSQSSLNFALRNAAAQMQIDVVNAGNGFYTGADIAAWPVGVTIKNNYAGSTSCYDPATQTYGADCFDELNIIATDVTVPLGHPDPNGSDPCGNPANDMANSSILSVTPTAGTLADYSSHFKTGDQILVVKSDGSQYATVTLTKDASVTGSVVKLQHNPTGADGTNTQDSGNDALGISWLPNNKLGTQFCSTDWVLKLAPIKYYVNASDPSNPKLMRRLTLSNTEEVVAEQIIGFKVGASVRTANSDSDFRYKADNAPTDDPMGYSNDWTSIRAVRITIIGRTPPITGPTQYHNGFDQGPYKVEALSVVVNPRNLSMND
jgi:hypothetical protein